MNTQVASDETPELIASDKVEGTAVFDRSGEKLGVIHNFMVDKRSGRVEYAVLRYGGVMGVGGDYYPLPWTALTYDTRREGYVVNLDRAGLERAPHFRDEAPSFDRAYRDQVYSAFALTS